jgi:small subunit ribosomal protein S6
MRYYETLYVVRPDLQDEEYSAVLEKFRGIIEKNTGVIVKIDEWGKRKFAYLVKKYDQGFYILMNYCGDPGLTQKLERDLRLDERVLKYITIKLKDKADPAQLIEQEGRIVSSQDEIPDKIEENQKDNTSTVEEVTDGI